MPSLKIQAAELATVAASLAPATKHGTVPILQHALFDAEHGIVSATDMQLWIKRKITVTGSGAFTAPIGALGDFAKKLATIAEITIETDGDTVRVTSGRYKLVLPSLPVSEFPMPTRRDDLQIFRVDGKALAAMIDRTQFSVCQDETKVAMCGTHMHVVGDKLRVVTTNANTLAITEIDKPEGYDGRGLTIPATSVAAISRMLAGTATLGLDGVSLTVECGEVSLTTKLIDYEYPEYQRVIPANDGHVITFEVEPMRKALDVVAPFAGKTPIVKLTPVDGGIDVSASGENTGSGSGFVECECDKDLGVVGFNATYLRGALASMTTEARIVMRDSAAPALMTDPDDASTFFVICGVRV